MTKPIKNEKDADIFVAKPIQITRLRQDERKGYTLAGYKLCDKHGGAAAFCSTCADERIEASSPTLRTRLKAFMSKLDRGDAARVRLDFGEDGFGDIYVDDTAVALGVHMDNRATATETMADVRLAIALELK